MTRQIEPSPTAPVSSTYPSRDFSRYDKYLLPLDKQLELLSELCRHEKMPESLRPPSWWLDVDTSSTHVQSVEDLEFFLVVHGTLADTLAFNRKLVTITQGKSFCAAEASDVQDACLDPNAYVYESGLHRVRINLVDNWSPDTGRTVDQVCRRAIATRTILTSVEPLGAYGLHSELLKQQDGKNLPSCDLAGIRQGLGGRVVPGIRWGEVYRRVYLGSSRPSHVHHESSAPSLVAV